MPRHAYISCTEPTTSWLYIVQPETGSTELSSILKGVHLQDDLGWNTHVGHAKSKASRMLGVVQHNLYRCPENLKKSAYVSLVRPHTKYASVAWDPHQKGHKKDLERVQWGAARFLKSDYSREKGTVTNLLKEQDWPDSGGKKEEG